MRNFILGLIVGAVIASVTTAWALSGKTLYSSDGVELGTVGNPLYIS